MEQQEFFIGDMVGTKHGITGTVYAKDHLYRGTPGWFNNLNPHPPESVKSERWYHILVRGGGAVYHAESDLSTVLFDKLDNKSSQFYFGKDL